MAVERQQKASRSRGRRYPLFPPHAIFQHCLDELEFPRQSARWPLSAEYGDIMPRRFC